MITYGQVVNGVFTGVLKRFDFAPDPNPVKDVTWLPYTEKSDPPFDLSTQKLTAATVDIVGDQLVRSRAVVSLSADERLAKALTERSAAYQNGTLTMKSTQGDRTTTLGFWVDALVSELLARGSMQTAEMQALASMRDQVKKDIPKP